MSDGECSPKMCADATASAPASTVGQIVHCKEADDRKLIRLVKARPLLFARCNMPVASYYRQVKLLWKEVADEMRCAVVEVRRKWSHIRNSYSRHLRNELSGARTVKGRAVSRWYLADELDFLKQHMATDRRGVSLYPWLEPAECNPEGEGTLHQIESVEMKPLMQHPWYSALPTNHRIKSEPPENLDHDDSSNSHSHALTPEHDDEAAYFQFFRSIFNDYKELVPKQQRLFRRQCLNYLHDLLDDSDQLVSSKPPRTQQDAINLTHAAMKNTTSVVDAGHSTDHNMCVLANIETIPNNM